RLFLRRRCLVSKAFAQQLHCIMDEGLSLVLAYVRQVFALDRARLTAVPPVRLVSVRMNAEGCKLLPVAQQFNLLICAAIGCGEARRYLLERCVCSKRHRTFRRIADANKDGTAFLEAFAHK